MQGKKRIFQSLLPCYNRGVITIFLTSCRYRGEAMLSGIGVDLVSIKRIKKIMDKFPDKFLKRILTDQERLSLEKRGMPAASVAARFAAKEAVLKAIGCGIGPAALCEVEIISPSGKKPLVRLHGCAAGIAKEKNITEITISMTHEAPFACAVAAAAKKAE